MAVYAISYDLHKKGEVSYENLMATIKSYDTWCHHLESDWVVVSSKSAKTIRDELLPHIHKDDKLSVFKLSGEGAWYNLPDNVSDWLQKNL